MECCSGNDLFAYLEQRNFKLSEERAVDIIYNIAKAITYLHEFNIVHRDIKSENIIMVDDTEKSNIKLLDFGLSKILKPGDKLTETVGTLVSLVQFNFLFLFSLMLLQKYYKT